MKHYDYIIAGAGASGLSLIMHMLHSGQFNEKRILLIDRHAKTENDRTWCFWEKDRGLFDQVVYKRWKNLWFYGNNGSSAMHESDPYEYKMIRGIDFYQHCFDTLKRFPNVDVLTEPIIDVSSSADHATVITNHDKYSAGYVFNSIPPTMDINEKRKYFLWQHFKGWVIETKSDFFDPDSATLMDFRVDQKRDCRFVYVMPLSRTRALIEYTGFSGFRLEEDEYKSELASYCLEFLRLLKESYEIIETEFGMIPMTNYDFPRADNNVIYIGTAGGQTKASSGYTFSFVQKHSKKIVDALLKNKSPVIAPSPKKFNFYDSILLKILTEHNLKGADIFTTLFTSNKMKDVFKFLDNETSVKEDLKLISSLPTAQFLSAAFSHIIGKS